MKKAIVLLAAMALASVALVGCDNQTAEQKIQQQVKERVHSLTADERPRASANAKTFFEKEFPVIVNGERTNERGVFLECRPSDSNFMGATRLGH